MSRSRGVRRLGRGTDIQAVARQEAAGRQCAVRADLPGLCQRHRRCMRPQIPGLAPGGLGPHRTSSGSPAGFPPVSRFARRALPPSPAVPGFPSSGVLRFGPFGRCPVPVLRRFPSGFPSLSNLHLSAAAGRFRRRRSRAAGTKVTSPAATTSPGSRDPPALQMGSGRARWDAAAETACYQRPRAQDIAAAEPPRAVRARDAARTATTQRDRRAASPRCAGQRDRGPVQVVSSGWPCWLAWLSALTWPAVPADHLTDADVLLGRADQQGTFEFRVKAPDVSRRRPVVLPRRRCMPARNRPAPQDTVTVRQILLDGPARDADIFELLRFQDLAGPVVESKTATADQRAEFADIDQRLRRIPADGDYLPTKTGNILRAGERRPAENSTRRAGLRRADHFYLMRGLGGATPTFTSDTGDSRPLTAPSAA